MRSKSPLIALLVAVVLAVGFWFLLYSPKADEQAAIEAETVQLEQEASSLRSQIAQLEEVKANKLEVRAALARLEEYIPRGEVGQPAALRQFQLASDAAGTEITSLTFGDPEPILDAPDTSNPETALAKVAVSMVVEGGYFQLVDFMRRVEVDMPRALLVDGITVAEESELGFPALSTTWTGSMFAVVPVSATAPTPDAETAPADAQEPAGAEAPVEGEAPAEGEVPAEAPAEGETPVDAPAEGEAPAQTDPAQAAS
ncbi:MAG: type 4a pilus biogenesis protein PilO [Egibacteraceae bacterium]